MIDGTPLRRIGTPPDIADIATLRGVAGCAVDHRAGAAGEWRVHPLICSSSPDEPNAESRCRTWL